MTPFGKTSARTGVLLMLLSASVAAAPPVVRKIEPPNWWAGHSINPVRLLIEGENLQGAVVKSQLRTERVTTNASGTYLFADVYIPRRTRPGSYPLFISTADGNVQAEFEVSAPLTPQGRFQGFGPDDVMYLIMPDRFANGDPSNDRPAKSADLLDRTNPRYYHGGDLQGIITRLPYLRDLGVSALWLNPLYDNNDRTTGPFTDYHGYGPVDFYAVDEHLGSMAKLRELVDEAHAEGIRIVLDQVANHCGPTHRWVQNPPNPAWFHGSASGHLSNRFQAWTVMDPYAIPAAQQESLEGWFLNLLPDLNQNDEEVRRYLIQNALWWIGMTGIDGVRLDTLPYVDRRFWSEWTAAIKREYPRLRIVGEVLERDPALVSFFQGGHAPLGTDTRVDTVFDFPLYFAARRAFAEGGPLIDVPAVLARDRLYPDPSVLVTHIGLHDVPRFLHEQGATIDGLKLAFTFLMTTRGMPLIYYGDEIALTGGPDPDNRRDFPGGWPSDPRNAFVPSGRTTEGQDVWQHVRKLILLRTELTDLRRGRLTNILMKDQQYVYKRGNVIVALNNDTKPARITFDVDGTIGADDRLGSGARLEIASRIGTVQLRARSGAIFVLR